MRRSCLLMLTMALPATGASVDSTGNPAGIFATTPCPITELSASYTYSSTIYSLGTLYFVDGASADDTGNGLSLATAKKTIGAAMTTAGNGNKTIMVRGAHDDFDGTYTGTFSLSAYTGTSDTARWMIVGYGQERPIIDGGNGTDAIFRRSTAGDAFITLQRLKLQNTQANGVRLGVTTVSDKRDQHFNCIDLWFYSCGNNDSFTTDGNCYYLNADYGFISHCLFERSVGHGVKLGDGASQCIVEWSVSRENGWWPGRTSFSSRTVALDFPADVETSTNNICRYNIGYGCVSHGFELRKQHAFTAYNNEVYDFGHGVTMTGSMGGVVPHGISITGTTEGTFANNIIHDPAPGNTSGHMIQVATTTNETFTVALYNNVVYGVLDYGYSISLDYQNAAHTLVYNNTIVQSNATYAIGIRSNQGWTNDIINNVIWQQGTGSCGGMILSSIPPIHHNNVLYYPNGSAPEWGTTGDIVGNPILSSGFKPLSGSPAINAATNLSTYFTYDADFTTRFMWDIGAYKYGNTSRVKTARAGHIKGK